MIRLVLLYVLLLAIVLTQTADQSYDTEKLIQIAQTAGDTIVGGSFNFISPCAEGETAYDNCIESTINGCGPEGSDTTLTESFPYNDVLTSCCNQHDNCYCTCGGPDFQAHFKKCNDDFKACMYAKCQEHAQQEVWYIRGAMETLCKANAYVYWKSVVLGGQLSYITSQIKHCGCYDPSVQEQPSC